MKPTSLDQSLQIPLISSQHISSGRFVGFLNSCLWRLRFTKLARGKKNIQKNMGGPVACRSHRGLIHLMKGNRMASAGCQKHFYMRFLCGLAITLNSQHPTFLSLCFSFFISQFVLCLIPHPFCLFMRLS